MYEAKLYNIDLKSILINFNLAKTSNAYFSTYQKLLEQRNNVI